MNRTAVTVILIVVITAAVAAVIWTATHTGKPKAADATGEVGEPDADGNVPAAGGGLVEGPEAAPGD